MVVLFVVPARRRPGSNCPQGTRLGRSKVEPAVCCLIVRLPPISVLVVEHRSRPSRSPAAFQLGVGTPSRKGLDTTRRRGRRTTRRRQARRAGGWTPRPTVSGGTRSSRGGAPATPERAR